MRVAPTAQRHPHVGPQERSLAYVDPSWQRDARPLADPLVSYIAFDSLPVPCHVRPSLLAALEPPPPPPGVPLNTLASETDPFTSLFLL